MEAGSGSGRIVNFLCSKMDAWGVGVDYSDEGNELGARTAQAMGASVAYVSGDLGYQPFPDGTFDMVFSDSVIEHLPDTEGAIAEMSRVTKQGGFVIVTTPNRLRPDGWDLYKRLHNPPYLQKSFTPAQLRRIYEASGLSVERFFGDTLLLERNFKRRKKLEPGASSPGSTQPPTPPTSPAPNKGRYLKVERFVEPFWPRRFWINIGVVGRKQ
jgi:ubiquinone/menaquinone biosynthesis C-methylase UbiE